MSTSVENLIAELREQKASTETESSLKERLIEKLTEMEEERTVHVIEIGRLKAMVGETETEAEEMKIEAPADGAADPAEMDGSIGTDHGSGETEIAGKKTAVVKPADTPPIDTIPMNERRRFLIKVVMLIRFTFRGYFGVGFANKWGFYVDRHMCRKVRDFCDWMEYPRGDHVLEGQKDQVRSTVISKDGYFLFTGYRDGMVIARNMLDHRIIREWKAHEEDVRTMAFRAGLLVSGSFDNSVKIWDTWRDYQLIHTLKGHKNNVTCVNISDGAAEVVSGSMDKSIRIWSVRTGECVRVLKGHSGGVTSVMCINNIILSASYDLSMKKWSRTLGIETQNEESVRPVIFDLSINCESSRVVCATENGLFQYTWPELEYIGKVDGKSIYCVFHPSPN